MQPKRLYRNDPGFLAKLEYLLLGDLRELLSDPPMPETRHQLMTVLDGLFEMLPFRIAAKERGGYLAEVTRNFPGWSDQVQALGAEHGILYEDLRCLRREVSEADGSDFLKRPDAIVSHIGEWMERFARHEREERRLVQTASNLELGVGA
jgi:hypothetical protein